MKAFNGSKKFKSELLAKALEHKAADDYRAGTFGELKAFGFKGCSVGCTIYDIDPTHDKNDYEFLATKLGVPLFVVHLQDVLFEGKSNKAAWTYDFLSSINVNSDLTSVLPKFLLYIVQLNPTKESYFDKVVGVLQSWDENGYVDQEKAQAAISATDAAKAAKASTNAANWAAISATNAASSATNATNATNAAKAATNAANWAAKAATSAINAANWATSSEVWSDIEQRIFDDIADEFLRLIRECQG